MCKDHFTYAIDLHINTIQNIDVKQELNVKLFPTIRKLSDLMYLFERFTNTNALVLVTGTVNHLRISEKQKQIYNDLEMKIDHALEK